MIAPHARDLVRPAGQFLKDTFRNGSGVLTEMLETNNNSPNRERDLADQPREPTHLVKETEPPLVPSTTAPRAFVEPKPEARRCPHGFWTVTCSIMITALLLWGGDQAGHCLHHCSACRVFGPFHVVVASGLVGLIHYLCGKIPVQGIRNIKIQLIAVLVVGWGVPAAIDIAAAFAMEPESTGPNASVDGLQRLGQVGISGANRGRSFGTAARLGENGGK